MKRKGCLVFIKIGSILLITKGVGVPLASATSSWWAAPPKAPMFAKIFLLYLKYG